MSFTTPRTWVAGEVVSAALMNTHIRDNERYLKGTDGEIVLEDYIDFPSTAQGDVFYHNGTKLARLAAGTSGHFLKTQGAAANPLWEAPNQDYNAGSSLGLNSSGEVSTGSAGIMVRLKAIRIGRPGTVTTVFDIHNADGINTAEGRVYRKIPDVAATAVGTLRQTTSATYVTVDTENITVVPGDVLELWGDVIATGTCYIRNFKVLVATTETTSFRDET